MSAATVLAALEQELVDAGIARLPNTTGGGARPWLPPLWRQPEGGAPAPGDKKGTEADDGLVLTVAYTGGIPPRPRETMLRKSTFDIWLRGRSAPVLLGVENTIRQRIAERRNYIMGAGDPAKALRIIECIVWRDPQPLGSSSGQGHTWVVSYIIETYQAVPARDW